MYRCPVFYDNKIIILRKRLLSGITTYSRRNIKNNFHIFHAQFVYNIICTLYIICIVNSCLSVRCCRHWNDKITFLFIYHTLHFLHQDIGNFNLCYIILVFSYIIIDLYKMYLLYSYDLILLSVSDYTY